MDTTKIQCNNAGLVLLSNFLTNLFNRLELTKNEKFKDAIAQQKAVLSLQYLATGQTNTLEEYWYLNKVLCGLPLSASISCAITFSNEEMEIMDSLLGTVIEYCSEMGSTSIDGFRGNWLVRNGVLKESSEKWNISVERRVYDILLSRVPFSYSIIKLPWMSKPLYVTWSY